MLQMKVYICCKMWRNLKKVHLKMTNRDHPFSLLEEMKVTKVLRAKCELVAGIARGIVMTHSNTDATTIGIL